MRDKVAACIKRYDVSFENIVKIDASMTGLSEDRIYLLKDVEVFESSRKTHNLRRKLMKKHLIEPITDDLGRSKRKIYRVTPQFKAMLNFFKPRGDESFLPGYVIERGCYETTDTVLETGGVPGINRNLKKQVLDIIAIANIQSLIGIEMKKSN